MGPLYVIPYNFMRINNYLKKKKVFKNCYIENKNNIFTKKIRMLEHSDSTFKISRSVLLIAIHLQVYRIYSFCTVLLFRMLRILK